MNDMIQESLEEGGAHRPNVISEKRSAIRNPWFETPTSAAAPLSGADHVRRMRRTGRLTARSTQVAPIRHTHIRSLNRRMRAARERIEKAIRDVDKLSSAGRFLADHIWVIRLAEKNIAELPRQLKLHPAAAVTPLRFFPRVESVARAYWDAARDRFTEDTLVLFLNGYQEIRTLELGELTALKSALQWVLLDRIATVAGAPDAFLGPLLDSLRRLTELDWRVIFNRVCGVDRELNADPAGVYTEMDEDSKSVYRHAVARLAHRSPKNENEVARAAVEMARAAMKPGATDRVSARRAHVGYYLIDKGEPELRRAIRYEPTVADEVREAMLDTPTFYYLVGIAVTTCLLVFALNDAASGLTTVFLGFLLMLLPASQAAVDLMNHFTCSLIAPRVLPKLDFSQGIPDEHAALVAVPTLLLNEMQVVKLVSDLEIRYLANRDPNLSFALITDWPDADRASDESRDPLVHVCIGLIEDLNRRYGDEEKTPFYLLHRHRVFNPLEGRWMGWERKRGKIIDLNQVLRGGYDSFPIKVGRVEDLARVRYVITLDSDTQLPPDTAQRLVGTLAHPLNRAVVDPVSRKVVDGYGILQPRIGVSVHSVSRSRLAGIFSGQTGLDIYTRAVSDVYQDLFGEGIFTGKGIYEVDTFRATLEERFPENALLSHDLIEGAYARAGLVSDIELIDDYPSHFSAYSRRKHRWVRGDWQILRWLMPVVPDLHGRQIANPINAVSRWKIMDNLRRSLFEPSLMAFLMCGWLFMPHNPWHWTAAGVAVLLLSTYFNAVFSAFKAPWGQSTFPDWAGDAFKHFIRGHLMAVFQLAFLPHQALLSLDAILRSLMRVFVTKRRLLEWETAAEAEAQKRGISRVDFFLILVPYLTILAGVAVGMIRLRALWPALPVMALWIASRFLARWLSKAPRAPQSAWAGENADLLHETADRTWRYYEEHSNAANHWLVPDNVNEKGDVDLRVSPTNLGFLLNARIAAVHFGRLTVEAFAEQTAASLATLDELPKHRGHIFNWYDGRTKAPMHPLFVSTVDSGNLAASLWTLKQAALAFARDKKSAGAAVKTLEDIAARCERLVSAMDFSFLYQERRKLLSIGYNVTENRLEPSCYDLLASEARLAVFIAIAKGDVPQDAWFHLGRKHALAGTERALISWTGTIFEYLMPALWMRHSQETTLRESMEAAVRVQMAFGRSRGVPWGISESACVSEDARDQYGYAAFGIPALALKRIDGQPLVITPYASALALCVDPRPAIGNLREMADLGWTGRYGFFESVDYSKGSPEPVRIWMAHHQGMILLAAANLMFGHPFQEYFHAEPHVQAAEPLLHERVPRAA